MYLAEDSQSDIVGFVAGSLGRRNNLFEREIYSIYILKEFQQKGIEKLLIKVMVTKFL